MPDLSEPVQDTDLAQAKADLRRQLLSRRRQLAAAQGEAAAVAVAERLVAELAEPAAIVVAGYWPLVGELDPRPAMARLAAGGHRLALPRMAGPGAPLGFLSWRAGERLVEGRFRVMEPDPAAPVARPDLLLVPLVGFDRAGHRLGHGAGYYDRTLQALRAATPRLRAIGLAFAGQEVVEVPAGPTDQRLDAVVTERAVHRIVPVAPSLAVERSG